MIIRKKNICFFLLVNLFFGFSKLQAQPNLEGFDNQEVKNLVAFAKSYGYIRFFYPNTQTKDFNWDAFLVYGIKKVRNVKTDIGLEKTLSELFSSIAPFVKFSKDKNNELNVKTISQGDSISFWQHSSFSIGENKGVKSEGTNIRFLVTTKLDSAKAITPDNSLLNDKVQFEFVDYFNKNEYYYPSIFRESEFNSNYILDKQPGTLNPFSSMLNESICIKMPIVLTKEESMHNNHQNKIETFSQEITEFYEDVTIYENDDIWFADFISVWNAIHHLYAYRKRSEKMFGFKSHNKLAIGLDQILGANDKKRVSYKVVRNYISLFKDPHVSVFRYKTPDLENTDTDNKKNIRSWLPFYRVYIEDGIYVSKSFDSKIKIGDEILKIDNTKVSILIEEKLKSGIGSPQSNLHSALGTIGFFINKKTSKIQLKRNGKLLTVKVKTLPAPAEKYFEHINNPFNHKAIEYPNPTTIYLNPSLLKPDDVANILDELLEAKHLIIDLRSYPKAKPVLDIFQHLPVSNGLGKGLILSSPLIMYPNQEQNFHIWRSPITVPTSPFITAKLSVLISNSTISRGETFSSYFKYAGATLFGDFNTAGASGGIDWLVTPGKIRFQLTTSYTVRQDGEEMQSIGITPDILVKQTAKGLSEGKDQIYEVALKRIQQE